MTPAERMQARFPQPVRVGDLIGLPLLDDLDGTWVDGDCWAVKPDYCEASQRICREKTGIEVLPKNPEEKGWNDFLELQREQFRQYVTKYTDALHRAKVPATRSPAELRCIPRLPRRPSVPLELPLGRHRPIHNLCRRARTEGSLLRQLRQAVD